MDNVPCHPPYINSLATVCCYWKSFLGYEYFLWSVFPLLHCLQIQKWCLYQGYTGRGVVSVPIGANEVRDGPASADQGCSIASQSSCHAHDSLC